MAPPFALPPPDFPIPAYVRQAESGLLMPRKAVLPGLVMPPGLIGGAGKVPFDISFTDEGPQVDNKSSHTYFGLNLGDPHPSRMIVVQVANSVEYLVSSVSIGGIAATRAVRATGTNMSTDLWYAAVPSGTSANVAINWSNMVTRGYAHVMRVVGLTSMTPVDTSTGSSSTSIDAPEGGGFIVAGVGDENQHNRTLNGATKFNEIHGHRETPMCGGYITPGATQLNRNVSITGYRALVAAAWV